MVTRSGAPKTTPAPWVSYTRAGCDVGNVCHGEHGAREHRHGRERRHARRCSAPARPSSTRPRPQRLCRTHRRREASAPQADFVGIAIHCASGGGICNGATGTRPDLLPDEPGGYAGFQALFGAKYVDPAINHGSPAVNDVNGNPITDPTATRASRASTAMSAANTLGYVAQMQESGIPITYALHLRRARQPQRQRRIRPG